MWNIRSPIEFERAERNQKETKREGRCRELASEGFQVRRNDELESEIRLKERKEAIFVVPLIRLVQQAYLHVFNIEAENKNHEMHDHVGRRENEQ